MKLKIFHNHYRLLNESISQKTWEKMQSILDVDFPGFQKCPGQINLILCGNDEIKSLNKNWRGKDKITDVLSFPYFTQNDFNFLKKGDIYEEIYLCVPQCRKQADYLKHSVDLEVLILFIHSILHGLEFDHETEQDFLAMQKQENQLLNLLKNIFIK